MNRFIDIFQGRAPRNVLATHYTPQGTRLLREIYEKANMKILDNNSSTQFQKYCEENDFLKK